MCHRARIWSIALLALGAGFVLSCLFVSWLIRLFIGGALIAASLLLCHHT